MRQDVTAEQAGPFAELARELDALKARAIAAVDESDLGRVKRLRKLSRLLEVAGRLSIHGAIEPTLFTAGVLALALHKQLEAIEIGHACLHGAYDKFESARAFHSRTFSWLTPIDEECWREGHNVRHHGNTNIAGKDPDLDYGLVRLTQHTPHRAKHYAQLALLLAVVFPNAGAMISLHFGGVVDLMIDNGLGKHGLNVLPDRSSASVRRALRRVLRKWLPYYGKEYVLFPLLAGPLFWKVVLGNALSELLRDLMVSAIIACNHTGPDVRSYPASTKARSRGEWYAMQIEASNNFDVPRPISVLCGGLELQIEHHLFPTLPPARLREIAPEVRAICRRHALPYRCESWPRTLGTALAHVARLSRPTPFESLERWHSHHAP